MKTGIIYHHNLIEEEINISLEKHPDVDGEEYVGRQIFCKKLHKITEPLAVDCDTCPYFAGWMQGHGHECAWEDVLEDSECHYDGDRMIVYWEEREQEFHRVSKLIEEGILQRG